MTAFEAAEPEAAPLGWRDRWRSVRNRMIGSPDFQRWAARFPLTRPMARRRSQALFDLTAGFVYSQVLHACVRSGLLEALAAAPLTTAAAARRIDLGPAAAERLLKAGVALKLVERCGDGRYGLGVQGAALLGAPGVTAMVEHHAALYADLADPLALLRRGGGGGRLSDYWAYAETRGEAVGTENAAAYSTLMSASQAMVAAQVLDAYPLHHHRKLLDVGGGDGTFLRAAAARTPGLELALFDLPSVAERARTRFAADGIAVRATGGSFFDDPLPIGADVASLIRVLHDHDDAEALKILTTIRGALPPGGVLLIGEPMSETRGAEPVGDAYFGFYLLAMGSGRPRTPKAIADMAQAAGFARARRVRTAMPMIAGLIVANA